MQQINIAMESTSFSLGTVPTSLENAPKKGNLQLGARVAGGQSRNLEINKWLPAAAEVYNISKDIRDYVIVPVPSIISDIPNTNGDSASMKELLKFNIKSGRLVYESWIGKPTCCFPADAPIKTIDGYVNIQDVKVGDKVLTHKGRYKKVVHTFKNGLKSVASIKCQGLAEEILATSDHPFWVIDQRQFYSRFESHKTDCGALGFIEKEWSELKPHFRPVTDMYAGDYLCVPITIGGKTKVDKDFAFLTGLHMAEGSYIWNRKEGKAVGENPVSVFLTLGRKETALREHTLSILEKLKLEYNVYWHAKNNTCSIYIKDVKFASEMYTLTGEYAHEKRMQGALRSWDDEALKWFLGGYISGDGCIKYQAKHALVRCRTASKLLATDIWHTMARLGITGRSNKDAHPYEKEYFCPRYEVPRTIKSKGSYVVSAADWSAHILNDYIVGKMKMKPQTRDKTQFRIIVKGDYILTPIVSIQHKVSRKKVYNIEVEDDNSYVAYDVVVHNCEHDNKDPLKARGVILDSYLSPLRGFAGNLAKVVKLMAYDRTKDPVLVDNILKRKINTYSMGFMFKAYECSICGHVSYGQTFCGHTRPKQRTYRMNDNRLCYRRCMGLDPIEISIVADPAYVVALSDIILDPRSL